MEEGVALVMAGEFVFASICAGGGMVSHGFGEPAVEAFDHAIGLGMEGFGQAVLDGVGSAPVVEGMVAGGFAFGLALLIDGETIGEFGTVVG